MAEGSWLDKQRLVFKTKLRKKGVVFASPPRIECWIKKKCLLVAVKENADVYCIVIKNYIEKKRNSRDEERLSNRAHG